MKENVSARIYSVFSFFCSSLNMNLVESCQFYSVEIAESCFLCLLIFFIKLVCSKNSILSCVMCTILQCAEER